MRGSGRRSSRSALTARGRSRSGSTAMSGPNSRHASWAWASPSCPTGSLPATIPLLLQRICDSLQPGTIEVFFQRWLHRLPLPSSAGRPAGRLVVGTVNGPGRGVPHHLVFTQPRYARAFFEALVTDNLDLGRPDTMEIIFDRQDRHRPPARYRRRVQDQRRSPAAPRSPSTPSTSTRASSSTSKTAAPCGSRPS